MRVVYLMFNQLCVIFTPLIHIVCVSVQSWQGGGQEHSIKLLFLIPESALLYNNCLREVLHQIKSELIQTVFLSFIKILKNLVSFIICCFEVLKSLLCPRKASINFG